MKTKITVSWCVSVEADVNPKLLNYLAYVDGIRSEAVSTAGSNLNWKDGVVTDCEDFPQLVE